MKNNRCVGVWIASAIAVLFGLLTLKSGGEVLFIDGAGRAAAGNYVPYVLWFNFLMGFVYIVAGVGLWLKKTWAIWLSITIAVATLIIFAIFGVDILLGGLFEPRTVKAMILRSSVWISISTFAYLKILHATDIK
ncbi:MAG: hypothetical protein L3J51_09925 [Cocleimonas sp.]|nr:hypothetical protein [Cocleimonas sp.]